MVHIYAHEVNFGCSMSLSLEHIVHTTRSVCLRYNVYALIAFLVPLRSLCLCSWGTYCVLLCLWICCGYSHVYEQNIMGVLTPVPSTHYLGTLRPFLGMYSGICKFSSEAEPLMKR